MLLLILQTALMIFFFVSGVGKILGLSMHVNSFDRLRLPQWFRIVTGIIQLTSATGLAIGYFLPIWTIIASICLTFTMIGAILAHLRIRDSLKQMSAAITVFCLTLILLISLLNNL